MNVLDIDAGNSRLKWRLQKEGDTKASGVITNAAVAVMVVELVEGLGTMPVHACRMSICAFQLKALRVFCSEIKGKLGVVPQLAEPVEQASGLTVRKVDPRRLGCDRWLAMLGARALYPDQAVMVVDSGTALTLDVVGGDGVFQGGLICPGLNTMVRSMTESTDLFGVAWTLRSLTGCSHFPVSRPYKTVL